MAVVEKEEGVVFEFFGVVLVVVKFEEERRVRNSVRRSGGQRRRRVRVARKPEGEAERRMEALRWT